MTQQALWLLPAADLQIFMLGEEIGQVDGLVCPPLWNHHHTPDLLHLGVVWGTHSIQVARYLQVGAKVKLHTVPHSQENLGSKVRYNDELLEHILGEDVSEASLFDVVGGDVYVVGSQVEVSG